MGTKLSTGPNNWGTRWDKIIYPECPVLNCPGFMIFLEIEFLKIKRRDYF